MNKRKKSLLYRLFDVALHWIVEWASPAFHRRSSRTEEKNGRNFPWNSSFCPQFLLLRCCLHGNHNSIPRVPFLTHHLDDGEQKKGKQHPEQIANCEKFDVIFHLYFLLLFLLLFYVCQRSLTRGIEKGSEDRRCNLWRSQWNGKRNLHSFFIHFWFLVHFLLHPSIFKEAAELHTRELVKNSYLKFLVDSIWQHPTWPSYRKFSIILKVTDFIPLPHSSMFDVRLSNQLS